MLYVALEHLGHSVLFFTSFRLGLLLKVESSPVFDGKYTLGQHLVGTGTGGNIRPQCRILASV